MFIPHFTGFKCALLFANKYFHTNATSFVGFLCGHAFLLHSRRSVYAVGWSLVTKSSSVCSTTDMLTTSSKSGQDATRRWQENREQNSDRALTWLLWPPPCQISPRQGFQLGLWPQPSRLVMGVSLGCRLGASPPKQGPALLGGLT